MSVSSSNVVSISQYQNFVAYSRGKHTYDNQPDPIKALDFKEFIKQTG